MSLNIYTDNYKDIELKDVNILFSNTDILLNNISIKCVKEIDMGDLVSTEFFVDRDGYKSRINNLSTGCKCALLVNQGMNINILEAGINARDTIVRNCICGSINWTYYGVSIGQLGYIDKIDVIVNDKYKFDSLKQLSYYLYEEYPEVPNQCWRVEC